MRSAVFTLVGAFLSLTATFSYGIFFLDGATQEPAFLVVIGGTLVGGYIGLLVAALTRPSRIRRTQLFLLGVVGGLLAGLAYGVISLEDACESDPGFCGWVFMGRLFQRPWMPIALWTAFGGFMGAILGIVTGLGLPRREFTVQAGVVAPRRG